MLILLISKAELEREKERKRQSKVLPSMHGFTHLNGLWLGQAKAGALSRCHMGAGAQGLKLSSAVFPNHYWRTRWEVE